MVKAAGADPDRRDEAKTGEFLSKGFTEHGYEVVWATDGEKRPAEQRAGASRPPDTRYRHAARDGWSADPRATPTRESAPGDLLTSRDGILDRVQGSSTLGADDYLVGLASPSPACWREYA